MRWMGSATLMVLATGCKGASSPADTDPACLTSWYADRDADGWTTDEMRVSCTPPPGFVGFENPGDCDDQSPDRSPGAPEWCNALDDDCDGEVDEDAIDPLPFFSDEDGDGHGDPDGMVQACELPPGHAMSGDDCDDTNTHVHPTADEHCDGLDEDCDGTVDEDPIDGTLWWWDGDLDGYGDDATAARYCDDPLGAIATGGDCDDADAGVNPEVVETCNGIDDDCSGSIDDGFPRVSFWPDLDGDGFGDPTAMPVEACAAPPEHAQDDTDCDDLVYEIHPGAAERCNALDDDCDGTLDDELSDEDGDGVSVCQGDCDDASPLAMPGLSEVCDAVDNDCDGRTNDPWLDAWEPNDEITFAPLVADDDETVVLNPTISGPNDDDWFAMDTFDDAGTVPDQFRAWARLEAIPPGVELALHLYRNNILGQPRLVMSDTSWEDGVLEVERTGLPFSNDGNLYHVRVEVLDGYACESAYQLTLGNHD